jgi:hypothetical protein
MSEGRKLSRNETHDLGMIVKERTKVLKSHIESEGARLLADFERQIAAKYEWDQDEVWKAAAEEALKEAQKAQEKIAARCEALGIPRTFAPGLSISWHQRGENSAKERRTELRSVAKSAVKAMMAEAAVKVEREALDLRTQIVALGLLSPDAQVFLQTLRPVEQAMHALEFGDIEKRLEALPQPQRARLRYDA